MSKNTFTIRLKKRIFSYVKYMFYTDTFTSKMEDISMCNYLTLPLLYAAFYCLSDNNFGFWIATLLF